MKIRIKKTEKEYIEDEYGKLTPTHERAFDQAGRVVWEQHVYPSGEILSENEYEYYDKFLIREKSWNEHGEWTEIKYFYNETEILVSRETTDVRGNREIMKNILDEDKDILEFYNTNGHLFKKEIVYWNTKRQAIKRTFFEEDKIQEEHHYEYDGNGEICKRMVKFKNDIDEFNTYIFHYEYDKDKNEIFEIEQTLDKVIRYQKESQYEGVLLVKEIENGFEGSNETIITTYEYDVKQRLVKILVGNKAGKPRKQELFVYNEDESIIKIFIHEQSSSFDSPPTKHQLRREISFYE